MAAPGPLASTTLVETDLGGKEPEDVQSLLAFLTVQRSELKKKRDSDCQRERRAQARRARSARASLPDGPWRRGSAVPREFSMAGLLPVKYLEPLAAGNAQRPAKTYERPSFDKPFLDASSQSRLFPDCCSPTTSNLDANHDRWACHAGVIRDMECPHSRVMPRALRLNGMRVALRPPAWQLTHTSPGVFERQNFLDELLPPRVATR